LLGALLWAAPGQLLAEIPEPGWPTHYGGLEPEVRLLHVERRALAVLSAAMNEQGLPACTTSPRLVAAARAHAGYLLARTSGPRSVDPQVVRHHLLAASAVEPSVVPWAVSFVGEPDLAAGLGRLARAQKGRPPTHCGAGLARGAARSVVVVIGTRRRLSVDSFSARLVPGDRERLAFRLAEGYGQPSVLVTRPRGDIVEQPCLGAPPRYSAWLDFPTAGLHTVEVMAEGQSGPEVVALFPVLVGADPDEIPESAGCEALAPAGSGDAEAALQQLLGTERLRAGLPALEPDAELVRLAREHSADMVGREYFGHVSPSGSDVVERLRRAGFVVLRAAENLARSTSAAGAHRMLMDSPAHRANVLDPRLTHVGVGVARRGGEIVVTQIFVEW
jgi:uncharacterized protein YkwD